MQISLEIWHTPSLRQEEYCAYSEANHVSLFRGHVRHKQLFRIPAPKQKNYLMRRWSSRIEFIGHSHWRVRTIAFGRPAAMSQTQQAQETSWTLRFMWRFGFCDTERAHFQHESVSLCFRRQRSRDQNYIWRPEPQHETRFQNPQSRSRLAAWSHQSL